MTTTSADECRIIYKRDGLAAVAKRINDEGTSPLSEQELNKLASDEFAKQALPGERSNTAFARLYSAPENLELRKAFQVARNTPAALMAPVALRHDDTVSADVSTAAYELLVGKAKLLRATAPHLSEAQAFAKVFEADPVLAAKAHQRPTAAAYPFPR